MFPIASIVSDTPIPIISPITAPAMPTSPDSIRNSVSIWLFVAPIAFITPISLVRSSTAVYIVFIIPIPPTIKLINAMPITTTCTRVSIVPSVSIICCDVWTSKSSSPSSWFRLRLSFLSIDSAVFIGSCGADAKIMEYSSGSFSISLAIGSITITERSIPGSPTDFSVPTISSVVLLIIILFPTVIGFL